MVELLPPTSEQVHTGNGLRESAIREKYDVGNGVDTLEDVIEDTAVASSSETSKRHKSDRRPNKYRKLPQQFYNWRLQHSLIEWRMPLVAGVILTTSIFLFNLILTLSVSLTNGLQEDGRGIIYKGRCSKVKTLDSTLHVLINILSTMLLSTSNYAMQALSAPTRPEVDAQHANNEWLDIGVTSMRNLLRNRRTKLICWCILGLSSLPLHLFYNSTIFSTISGYGVDVVTVNYDFLRPDGLKRFSDADLKNVNQRLHYYESKQANRSQIHDLHSYVSQNKTEKLANIDCIRAFAQSYQTSRRAVVLVADYNVSEVIVDDAQYDPTSVHNSLGIGIAEVGPPAGDFDDDSCWWNTVRSRNLAKYHDCQAGLSEILTDPSSWAPFGTKIDYCIGIPAKEQCKLQFSVPVMSIVMLMNFTKAVILLWMVRKIHDAPLLTLGDAVASFLAVPDNTTSCDLLFRSPYTFKAFTDNSNDRLHSNTRPKRWATVISRKRWTVSLIVCILIGLLSTILGVVFSTKLGYGFVFTSGFGSLVISNFIDNDWWKIPRSGVKGLFVNVLLANLPQLVMSVVYFVYNGLYTVMALGVEWSLLATKQKGLRVSEIPLGSQRGAYFLSLPFRFSLPMMALWTCMHWILSQSFYLVSVDFVNAVLGTILDPDGTLNAHAIPEGDGEAGAPDHFFTCGVFPVGIMLVFILTSFVIAGVVIIGFNRLPTNIPLVGSNSRLISAACHPVARDEGDELRPVQLGLRNYPNGKGLYFAFSSQPVDYSYPSAIYDWWSSLMRARPEYVGHRVQGGGVTASFLH